MHSYPYHMIDQKLWPSLYPMINDRSVCGYCQSPLGPEGCYQVVSYGGQFHSQCLIPNMIERRQCSHCRSPFHSCLYLQFGVRDYMPTHLVRNPDNFPFDLHEFDGKNLEWSWRYNIVLRSSCGVTMQMEIGQGM